MASRARRFCFVFTALALLPGLARAHEIGGTRFEAPIPLDLLFVGAGATVGLTAVGLALANPTPSNAGDSPERRIGVVPSAVATAIRTTARGLFLLGFALALVDGLFGRQVAAENLATAFVWPVWIKGVALVAVLVGNPWPTLSPWRAIYDGLTRLEGRPIAFREYPDWLGQWPALVGFLAIVGVVENLTVIPSSPRATAVAVAGYALVMVLGAVTFGPTWLRRADAFAVLYRLLGRVAPLQSTRNADGGWALVVYTVSFDGFTSTPEYQTILFGLRDAIGPSEFGLVQVPLYLAGLALFVGTYLLVAGLTARFEKASLLTTAQTYALTIVPIAAAYEVAHNYPFVVGNLAGVFALAGELVGLHLEFAPLAWLSIPAFWGSQVALIVGGHLVAVVAVHLVAAERRAPPRALVPLTFLMVGYTLVSLWIVSRPVVS